MAYLGIIFLLFTNMIFAIEFNSGDSKAVAVELYTSEGCSSCPKADKWLSRLKTDKSLFKNIIPMAFHVDYWDYLGWEDPWTRAEFSSRQRVLTGEGGLSQVYTPAFLVAGNEWSAWNRSDSLPIFEQEKTGVLSGSLDGQELTISYSEQGDYELNIAYLGMGLVTKVTSGENRFRKLEHDFVVLSHLKQKGQKQWLMSLPNIPEKGQQETAISIWVTKPDSLEVEQAVAAFIE
jgi:hypothetical protein